MDLSHENRSKTYDIESKNSTQDIYVCMFIYLDISMSVYLDIATLILIIYLSRERNRKGKNK